MEEIEKFYFNIRMQIVTEHDDKVELRNLIVNELIGSPFLEVEVNEINTARPNIDNHVDSRFVMVRPEKELRRRRKNINQQKKAEDNENIWELLAKEEKKRDQCPRCQSQLPWKYPKKGCNNPWHI